MLDDFLTYIREQSLFQKNDRLLLAVSGGVDSIVLAHLFLKTGHNFAIAHCNFSLRGDESDKDQTFVKKLAKQYNVPFHTTAFDTSQCAIDRKLSIQMAARELRYQWFDQLINKHSYKYIATAHHHSDSIETVLFNLSKGTGISGIRGILPKNDNIIRSLLFSTKKEIKQYAKTHKLEWREDASNASDKYHRNYIRHNVLPKLEHINPSFENTAKATLERLKDAEEIVLANVISVREQILHTKGDDHFFIKEKLKLLSGRTTILHFLLKAFGFNYPQCKDIISHIEESGKLYLSKTHQANIDREYLIISKLYQKKNTEFISNIGDTHLSVDDFILEITQSTVPQEIPTDPNIGCFDLEKISFPLTVRTWQQGDKFSPLGMTQQKKVSDFLIDTKVPLNLKERVKVLVSNDQIIWVIGHRIDNRTKISKTTTQILQVALIAKN